MGTVLQYTLVYCSEKGMKKAVCIAIQTGCASKGARALGAGGGAHGAGSARALGERVQGERAQGAGTRHGQVREALEAAGAGRARHQARGPVGARGLGVLLGQQAVHLVHSACF